MLGDTLSTAAVIVGGFAISLTGQVWIDPLLSLMIAGMILWSSIGIVRETLHILLEGTPRGVLLEDVRTAIEGVNGVVNAHDLHVWRPWWAEGAGAGEPRIGRRDAARELHGADGVH